MIEIRPLHPYEAEAAKRLVVTVCGEFWPLGNDIEAALQQWNDMGVLKDMDDVQTSYFGNGGIFLVLTDGGRIVGTGAILRTDDELCELKRMWFLPAYRGRGLGMKMAQQLLEFAREAGYKRIRLDTGDPQKQPRAVKLYERLGFTPVERYNDGPCTLFMEKVL